MVFPHAGPLQIYVPFVNYALMLLTVAVIAGFNGNGTHLGNAYGTRSGAALAQSWGLSPCAGGWNSLVRRRFVSARPHHGARHGCPH